MASIQIVVPVFNEAGVLSGNLTRILAAARTLIDRHSIRLLIVDDGSTDGTATEIGMFCRSHPEARALVFTRNFGKEAALQAGLDHADADAVILMDSDLQHPPELIPHLVRLWEGGAKVVEAVKTDRGRESLPGRLFSALFYFLFRRLAGLDLRGHSDYKLIDRIVVEQYRQLRESGRFFRGLIQWMNYPSAQYPFAVPARGGGRSAWSGMRLLRYAIRNITTFSAIPLQIVAWCGVASLVVGTLFGGVALWQKWQGVAIDGFTTVILLLIYFSGILMLSLGVIGHYLARIHEEIKGRPAYILRPPGSA